MKEGIKDGGTDMRAMSWCEISCEGGTNGKFVTRRGERGEGRRDSREGHDMACMKCEGSRDGCEGTDQAWRKG